MSNEIDWANISSAVAWHLIDRHAESWKEAGDMMDAFVAARVKAALVEAGEKVQDLLPPEHASNQYKAGWDMACYSGMVKIMEVANDKRLQTKTNAPAGHALLPIKATKQMAQESYWSGSGDASANDPIVRKTIYERMVSVYLGGEK